LLRKQQKTLGVHFFAAPCRQLNVQYYCCCCACCYYY